MGLLSLLGGAGGGGFGMDEHSSAAQSTPFYNQSGIYFNSAGAGEIQAGDSSASPTSDASRQTAGGLSPQSGSGFSSILQPVGGSSLLPYIAGAILLAILSIVLLRKK